MSKPPDHDELMPELPLGSREELEQALSERSRPTAADAARIAALDGLGLRQAIYRASDALAVFDDVLLQLQDESFCLADALESMDSSVLTSDHGWSGTLRMLSELPEEGDELRAVGLVKYRRYLRNRLEALEARQEALKTPPKPEPAEATDEQSDGDEIDLDLDLELLEDDANDEPRRFDQATVMYQSDEVAPQPQREARAGTDSESKGAVSASRHSAPEPPERLLRLHRGKPVALAVAGRGEVELWMGRSRFRLLFGESPKLVSDYGECGRLRNGRSLIGRSPDCEVVIGTRHDTVSRVHLEVEVEHGQLVAVTDLSSGGTYVRPEMVPRRTNAA